MICTLGASKGDPVVGVRAQRSSILYHTRQMAPKLKVKTHEPLKGRCQRFQRAREGNLDMDLESTGTNAMDAGEICLVYLHFSCIYRPAYVHEIKLLIAPTQITPP